MAVTGALPRNHQPVVWVLHDGKIGMANQVRGLAEALGWPITEKQLLVRAPWRYLPPSLWLAPSLALDLASDRLEPPWPDLLIACGRNSVAPARLVKRASGGQSFWVQVQDPRFARREIDLIVAPSHDPAPGGNVFRTLGAVHRVTQAKLSTEAARWAPVFAALPRPLIAVLIGGDNGAYRLTEQSFGALCDRLVALAKSGVGLAITPSRRTAAAKRVILERRLAGLPAYIWDGSGDNPYLGILGSADAVLVTADSVSMISEAAATGRPVHIIELEGGSDKFARFHRRMREAGIARPFNGTLEEWHYAPPDDTARAAAEIRRRFATAR
jgi:mitochondrial fission protein ELM1